MPLAIPAPVEEPAGGGGGGGGGGQDFSRLPFDTFDMNDGAWTYETKDQWAITSATYDAGGKGTYAVNAMAGDSKWSSAYASYPVAYRQAYYKDADGNEVPLTTDDTFEIVVKMTEFSDAADFQCVVGMGITTDPSDTVRNNYHILAVACRWTTGGGRPVILSGHGLQNIGLTTATTCQARLVFTGGTQPRQVNGSGFSRNGETYDSAGFRNSNKTRSTGQPVYLCFFVSTGSSFESTTLGDEVSIKLEYRGEKVA